jgi:hypothetical protein
LVALHAPLHWPQDIRTMRGFDQVAGEGARPGDFEVDRQELIRLYERLAGRAAEPPAAVHPLFGPLTPAEWMIWGYRHADHHLRQFGV